MATNIGYCTTNKLSSAHIAKVKVPSGGLVAGNIVLLDNLDSAIPNNYEVYTATQPTTAALGSKHFALIENGGFETLSDGRRPAGQPDFTQYAFEAGEVVTAVFLDPHLTFEIGVATVSDGTTANPASDIGKYIIPANGTYKGAVSSSVTEGGALKIVAVRNYPLGGNFGLEFAPTYICIAQ